MEEVKERRAARLLLVANVIRENILRDHPYVPVGLNVEITPDAAIDMFGTGILDCDDADFENFIANLRAAHAEHLDEDDIAELDDDERATLLERLSQLEES
jgi:hypothetical protein